MKPHNPFKEKSLRQDRQPFEIPTITVNRKCTNSDGSGIVTRKFTLPRISMHLAVLKERGHVEA